MHQAAQPHAVMNSGSDPGPHAGLFAHSPHRQTLLWGGGLLSLCIIAQTLCALLPESVGLRPWGPRVFVPAIPLVAAIMVWRLSRGFNDYTRHLWACMAWFAGLYSLTTFTSGWFGYSNESLVSVGNAIFVLATLFVVRVFAMLGPPRIKGITELRMLLEPLTITAALMLILWCTYQAHLFEVYRGTAGNALTTLFAFEVFYLFLVAGIVLSPRESRPFPRWLAGGLTLINITTISYLSLAVRGTLEPPFWVALTGSLGFVLMLAGVVSQFFPEPAYHRRLMQVSWYYPQILVLIALGTFFTNLIQERLNANEVRTALFLFATMAPMVLGRQFIIEQQNHRLTKELMELNSTLEARIEQRSNELEASRNQLIAAERLASLGQLTAGLAHEVNTPLAAAMTSFMQANELALEYRDSIGHPKVSDADHREIAAELVGRMQGGIGSLDRIGEIVRRMRNQTRQQIDGKTRFNLTAMLNDTLSLLQHSAQKARVHLTLEAPDKLPWYGEAGRVSQVVTNLVMNAIHACEDAQAVEPSRGGQVTVTLRASDDTVLLEVQDNGAGIPESIRDRIFEPLFSSKEAGRGTGLGLPIVRDIITSHFAGTLEFDSIIGQGTTFRVHLPKTASPAEATQDAVLT